VRICGLRRWAEGNQPFFVQQTDDAPNRVEINLQLSSDIGRRVFAVAALHDLEKLAMTLRVGAVIDPDAVA
jgi:hypothetical protein